MTTTTVVRALPDRRAFSALTVAALLVSLVALGLSCLSLARSLTTQIATPAGTLTVTVPAVSAGEIGARRLGAVAKAERLAERVPAVAPGRVVLRVPRLPDTTI